MGLHLNNLIACMHEAKSILCHAFNNLAKLMLVFLLLSRFTSVRNVQMLLPWDCFS